MAAVQVRSRVWLARRHCTHRRRQCREVNRRENSSRDSLLILLSPGFPAQLRERSSLPSEQWHPVFRRAITQICPRTDGGQALIVAALTACPLLNRSHQWRIGLDRGASMANMSYMASCHSFERITSSKRELKHLTSRPIIKSRDTANFL